MTSLAAFNRNQRPRLSLIERFFLLHWEDLGCQVIDHWDLCSVYCVRRTCSIMRNIVHLYARSRWNPQTLIRAFVKDTLRFMSFLREEDALILGAHVRHLMERRIPKRLHILNICIKESSVGNFEWLMRQEGLVFERTFPASRSLRATLDYYKHARVGPEGFCNSDVIVFRFHRMAFGQESEFNFIDCSVIVHIVQHDPMTYVVRLPTSGSLLSHICATL